MPTGRVGSSALLGERTGGRRLGWKGEGVLVGNSGLGRAYFTEAANEIKRGVRSLGESIFAQENLAYAFGSKAIQSHFEVYKSIELADHFPESALPPYESLACDFCSQRYR